MTTLKPVAMAGIAAAGWLALGLQFYLTTALPLAASPAVWVRIGNTFSFFTILTNLLVAVTLTVSLCGGKSAWGRFFSSGRVQTGVAVYIAVVGLIYSLLLRHLWSPVGAQKLADVLLHDIVPVGFFLYWLALVPKAELRWRHALLWLGYPVVYMAYTLVRGAATGWYPYPFVDVAVLGLPRALLNGALVLILFLVLGLIAIAIGRWMERGRQTTSALAL